MGEDALDLTVCCCLWSDWPEKDWGGEYVARLKRGVERNLSRPHRFVCFADDPQKVPAGIETRPLRPLSWLGCLPKLYVYSPEAGLEGRVILFDLDNVITGSLDDMAAYDGNFCVRARLPELRKGKSVPDGDMIAFRAETGRELWERFAQNPKGVEDFTEGRERWFIAREFPDCDLWHQIVPGQVVSYKAHCRGKGLPEDARVVSFHGRPRCHEVDKGWVREHWR